MAKRAIEGRTTNSDHRFGEATTSMVLIEGTGDRGVVGGVSVWASWPRQGSTRVGMVERRSVGSRVAFFREAGGPGGMVLGGMLGGVMLGKFETASHTPTTQNPAAAKTTRFLQPDEGGGGAATVCTGCGAPGWDGTV
jgi:hypothetical protein